VRGAESFSTAGCLRAAIPDAFGGGGLDLAEICREQARLAYRAPATALAVNMHLYWTGIAADLHRAGDHSLDWLSKKQRMARCSPPVTASAATIFRSSRAAEQGRALMMRGARCRSGRRPFDHVARRETW